MSIQVMVTEASESSRLYPRYAEQSDFLEVMSRVSRPWPNGLNLNGGEIIFDIDTDRLLANFDLMIPKSEWRVAGPPQRPRSNRQGGLVFSAETIEQNNIDNCRIEVTTDAQRSYAAITFGADQHQIEAIELSESCIALVAGDQLCGFFIDFS